MKKTIKIIDLLKNYADGKEMPRLIRYKGDKYTFNSSVTFPHSYIGEDNELFTRGQIYLNDEVEILDEEDEFEDIEELDGKEEYYSWSFATTCLTYKINQLIKNQKKIIERLNNFR